METGWVRLSRTCNNACWFCLDVDQLDKREVGLDEITAEIDAVAATGAQRVVLSGGEPTLSRHLLAAIRHAKARGLYVVLTTNGRIIQADKIGKMLEAAGLDEVRVSIHGARRHTHEQLVATDKAWLESLQGLKVMGRTGVRVVMNTVLTKPVLGELGYLLHLAMMGGMKEMQVRALRPEGRALLPEPRQELPVPTDRALKEISEVWFAAKEEVVLFTLDGFNDTIDDGYVAPFPVAQADEAALRMLRQRVGLHHVLPGVTALDADGMGKDFNLLVERNGGLASVGPELRARGVPLLDLPACVGGRPKAADLHGEDAVRGAGCGDCAERTGCPGLPKKLARHAAALVPPPAWSGVGAGEVLIVPGGEDALLDGRTLPALAAALAARGVTARIKAAPSAEAVASAARIVCGGAAAQDRVLALGGAPERLEVVDLASGDGVSPAAGIVRSFQPGRVDRLLRAGVPLGRVLWRPYPTPPVEAAPVVQGGHVLLLGATTDWKLLLTALTLTRPPVPVVAVDVASNPCPDVAGLTRRTDLDDDAVWELVRTARAVVMALRPAAADDGAARARDLRWLAVAAAAGRPVAALRGEGVEDLVRHERSGWLARRGDATSLADAIRRAFAGATLWPAAGSALDGLVVGADRWAKEIADGAEVHEALVPVPTRPWPAW